MDNDVKKVDFLLLDCQGHDYKILKQLDFEKYSPDIINFEHCLLTEDELEKSHKIIENNRYKYFIHGVDTCDYKIK